MNANTLRWFLARSDVEAADILAEQAGIGDLDEYMRRYWPTYFSADDYVRVYREAGEIEAKVDAESVFHSVAGQWRLQLAIDFFRSRNIKTALDFGCSRAAHAIHIHNAVGTEFTCVDIDETSIKQARKIVDRFAKRPESFDLRVSCDLENIPDQQYEAVMALEVLEHVRDMRALVESLERLGRYGGHFIASVPLGPIEYTMWVEQPQRNREHVRELTQADICEIWGDKPGLLVWTLASHKNKYNGMYEGQTFFTYQIDRKPLGAINWTRKLSLDGLPEIKLPGLDA